ncbi:MAG: hypothetical protein H7Y05_02650 [Steroidobacteraceae bacterium]|nr:hypothetical protein [Deltaproteobacteria bacterium]
MRQAGELGPSDRSQKALLPFFADRQNPGQLGNALQQQQLREAALGRNILQGGCLNALFQGQDPVQEKKRIAMRQVCGGIRVEQDGLR